MSHRTEHARRVLRPARRFLVTVVAGLTTMAASPLIAPPASAATTTVACTGSGDVAKIQAAVNAASSGDTIAIDGVCDFRNVAAHGGTTTSVNHVGVLVRPGSPVTDLTITSANGPQSATLLGGGEETAFAIAPDNDRVTIRGLVFRNFARPLVVLGADEVTIGAVGETPDDDGNHVFGTISQNSAILALGTADPMTVNYGQGTTAGVSTMVPGPLEDLTVAGNYVQYEPPGTGDPTGNKDIVAIDVRQQGLATVEGVTIVNNAVGMFTSEFSSFSQNSVRVQGTTAVPASATPALADYRISDVTIVDNNLGRLEEIEPEQLPDEVDSGDAHAGGRVGIVVHRVGDFTVAGNSLRSRISVTGASGMGGGGILAADSAFGSIVDNRIHTVSDPGTASERDFGAVGLVDDLAAMFGGSSADQAAHDIQVGRNRIGRVVPVRRGVVVAGASKATIHENEINSTAAGLHLGGRVEGPTGVAAPETFNTTVACLNELNGETDAAAGIAVTDSAASNGNSFPGGSLTPLGDNGECAPTLAVLPGPPSSVKTGDTLFGEGRAWSDRDVEITVSDDDFNSVSKTVTADGLGAYSVTFSDAELASLVDGLLVVVATARDARGFEMSSDPQSSILDLQNSSATGDVIIDDGGDGYTNLTETLAGTPNYWLAPSGSVVDATVWWSDGAGVIPGAPECGPVSGVDPTGVANLPINCAAALPQGSYRLNVQWRFSDNTLSAVEIDTSILDTRTTVPTMSSPLQGSTSTSPSVPVSGTAEPGSTVIVQTSTRAPLGNAVADGAGNWSTTISFADGTHRISAFSFDVAGNRSAASPLRTFHVNTTALDTTPPAAPVIGSPGMGTLHRSGVSFSGTAEPGARVDLRVGTTVFASMYANASGAWGEIVFMGTGVHTVDAVATDPAGNTSAGSVPVTFTVDADAPELEITTAPDSLHLLTDVVIDGRVRDNHTAVRVVVEYYDLQQNLVFAADDATCLAPGCPTPAATWVDWKHDGNNPSVGGPRQFFPPGVYYARAVAADAAGNTAQDVVRFVVAQA